MARAMIALERTALILLCAGRSERFGNADKLLHSLRGKPLVLHAADMLTALPFAHRVATVRPEAPDLHRLLEAKDFVLRETRPNATQAESLQCGLDAALVLKPDAILLALGDMPFVTAGHIERLAAAADASYPAVSSGADWTSPPWIASRSWVETNRAGIKQALLRDALRVSADPLTLRDIDRITDLD